jgi:hypothetical protein
VGEVIVIVVILVIVVVLVGGGLTFAVRITKPDPNALESPLYRNHLAMARWIEQILNDEMVRVTIPAERQQAAKRLVDDFFRDQN